MALIADPCRKLLANVYVRFIAGFLVAYGTSYAILRLTGAPNRIAAVNGLSLIIMALPVWGLALLADRHARFGYHLYFIWALVWVVDFFAVGFTMWRYGLPIESPVVVEAVSNTNYEETTEYILEAGLLFLPLALLVPLLAYGLMRLTRGIGRHLETLRLPRWLAVAVGVILVVVPLAYHTNHVVARADPVTRWAKFAWDLRQQEVERVRLVAARAEAARNVGQWQPRYAGEGNRTLVFVIGESSNRNNWSLFGYQRETTPKLDALRDNLVLFPDTVSSFGSTDIEVTRMLTGASHKADDAWQTEADVLLLVKAAGYKVFWLSNQNDFFLNTVFGQEADYFRLVNRGLGQRSDTSLDETLLPEIDKALADPAPLKFIIVHAIGSHQHYSLRYPEGFSRFDDLDDEISEMMAQKWSALREARNTYDNTILYTDFILSEIIGRLDTPGRDDASMLYVSDHGQEVGHLTSVWGHNFKLESGFAVPMFLWTRDAALLSRRQALETRPYQTDELDWTLLSMLGVSTSRDQPQFDLLGPAYSPWKRIIDKRPYIPGRSHVALPADG
ncbi:MAG: phosphoethanolamine transferase [Rhizobium sp.]|nr:phosphoethanolamine transferase [Rhizobium sp.]